MLLAGCGGGGDDDNATDGAAKRTVRLESQLTGVHRVPVDAPTGADAQLRLIAQVYEPGDDDATGRSQATCVRAQRGGGQVYNCDIVFVLPKGDIYGLAVASQDGPGSGAIVGGTGDFALARGTFEYGRRDGQRVTLTVKLG
jgi:hypothetical protein